jgi:hypothetical protein
VFVSTRPGAAFVVLFAWWDVEFFFAMSACGQAVFERANDVRPIFFPVTVRFYHIIRARWNFAIRLQVPLLISFEPVRLK